MPEIIHAPQRSVARILLVLFLLMTLWPLKGGAQSTLEYMTLQTQAQGGAQKALRQPAQDNRPSRERSSGIPTDWLGILKDFMNAVTSKVPPAQLMIILGLLIASIVLLRK